MELTVEDVWERVTNKRLPMIERVWWAGEYRRELLLSRKEAAKLLGITLRKFDDLLTIARYGDKTLIKSIAKDEIPSSVTAQVVRLNQREKRKGET